MKTPKVLALLTGELQLTEPILECKDYSSLQRLLRVTALAFKFVHILKSRVKSRCADLNLETTPEDLQKATVYWLKKLHFSLQEDKHSVMGSTVWRRGTVEVPGETE